ncbi:MULTISPECIES: cytochrome c biogenesis CcdA family protein [unclassified Micromonospora]|uniref:cytochrome c biogenesis CcdA family protein n=1 Tax=unclassified Micromonospora TaxID=2617518 RepID=UPI0003EEBF03|nr:MULTISPECIES: cytochrome c biogenesis protein CcdA [unclassified Micromonospora]EWM66487.1 cytochrome c biogenesis membrane protein [Micromonospora sp. M42]MCK1807705.1 cytochrome C biogenesis protein CcdA [Micromonospora sp. R42106]MCK1833973.1 cytochrome C biogenesis protein CcdA [Micromonospora sp. R42003]MCK1845883.1 cytochrome C biogenesis protein CcdA [Micromonospora sp. R42004]MCM1019458.1 cytochrome C biogenesis protein CcdA [Micromonospora sp. XM-20-01]
MGETFRQLAESGPLLFAVGAAALAGLVSFLSPCVLPLMPGYLSYVTGLAGADLEGARKGPLLTPSVEEGPLVNSGGASGGGVGVAERAAPARTTAAVKGRVLAGTLLFIAGFTVVFVATAILFSGVGKLFFRYERTLEIVIGALVVVLGLGYLGVIPGMQREFRIRWLPSAGLLGAPVLGAVFALSWLPCTGPTLGAVLGMAATEGGTDRAVVLAVAYCLGLGIPFVVFGLGFQRLLGVFRAVRRNSRWVTRIGGALLIAIGLALITGGWVNVVIWLQTNVGVGEVSI